MKRTAVGLLLSVTIVWLASGCNQEKNESIRLMNKGLEYNKDNMYSKAVESLNKAVEVWPENAEAHYYLGLIHHEKLDNPGKAKDHFAEACKVVPENGEFHYKYAMVLNELGDYRAAEKEYLEAVNHDEHHYAANYRLGMLYEFIGEIERAIDAYMKSINSNPTFPRAYNALGNLYYTYNRPLEALRVLENGVKNNPNDAHLHNDLGRALSHPDVGQTLRAVDEFKKALELEEKYNAAMYNLGMAYAELNDKRNAIYWLQKFEESAAKEEDSRVVTAIVRRHELEEEEEIQ